MRPTLPIEEHLDEIAERLNKTQTLVLSAAPGAGKSTVLPLFLFQAGLARNKRMLLQQPRRMAARMVAHRMADMLAEPTGKTVGYRIRFERKVSSVTNIVVLTEGILSRMLLSDPLLEDTSVVLLDEFHERSVYTDLALACLRETLQVREDLKLVIMSATLDPAPIASFLDNVQTLALSTQSHRLTTKWLAPRAAESKLSHTVRGVTELLKDKDDDEGDILVFLPGASVIERTRRELAALPALDGVDIQVLYGALPLEQQQAVLEPGVRRRVILSTNIAETSLTVPGVTAVVDSGLVKRIRMDPHSGLERLQTERISQASATQRAGRAGRVAPGRVVHLWSEHEHKGLIPQEPPEVLTRDAAGLLLSMAAFGARDAKAFLLQPPPDALSTEALGLLRYLNLVKSKGMQLTELGHRAARLPLHPRLAVMLLRAQKQGQLPECALLCATLQERRSGEDLQERLRQQLATGVQGRTKQTAEQLLRLMKSKSLHHQQWNGNLAQGQLARLALSGFPDRVCVRRKGSNQLAVKVHGGQVRIKSDSQIPNLFLALEIEASARSSHKDRVTAWLPLTVEDLETVWPQDLNWSDEVEFDSDKESVVGIRHLMYLDLVITQRRGHSVDSQKVAALLVQKAQATFDKLFRPNQRTRQLIARLQKARALFPDYSWPDTSTDSLKEALGGLCAGMRSFKDIRNLDWYSALSAKLEYPQRKHLDHHLPQQVRVPSGREVAIDYAPGSADGLPVLSIKLQELFGWNQLPILAEGRLPLVAHLLAPNGRPAQVTSDLAHFWQHGYPQVRKQLRGRYPKHPWPDDPTTARATAGTDPKRRKKK